MSFQDKFSAHAEDYRLYRPHYSDALAATLAGLTDEHKLAVDVGCGSGQLTALLGKHFDKAIGFDASAEQIAEAREFSNVSYGVAPAESLPIADKAADLVSVAQALHWFDIPAFWQEVRRIGKAGGMVAAICYGLCRITPAIDAVVDKFYGTLKPYWAPERRLIETAYRTIDFPFEEIGAPELQVSQNWNLRQFLAYISTWSAVKAAEKDGKDPMNSLENSLKSLYENKAMAVNFPLYMRVGRL